MATPSEGSEDVWVELETRDGSYSPVIVEEGKGPPAKMVEGFDANELNDEPSNLWQVLVLSMTLKYKNYSCFRMLSVRRRNLA